MKSKRQKISLILDVLITVMVLYAWACMIFRWGDNGTISAGGFRNLKYFTVLSNLLMAAASALNLVYTIRMIKYNRTIPNWVPRLKYAGATAVTLTLLVVLLFLWPVFKIPGLYAGANLWFHLLIPLMAICSFVLGTADTMTIRDSWLAVIPMIIYGAWYIGNNLINGVGEWPDTNDWYGFLSWGWGIGVVIFGVLVLMTWASALLMRLFNKKMTE